MLSPDFVIVGQGLAGTALAWSLLRRGRRILVVDRERGDSASRVAAGLITPVTGKRLARSWRWAELFPAAVAFYREIETEHGANFFHMREALRLFRDEAERARFEQRAATVREREAPPINPDWFDAPLRGFTMSAARLDVARYLDLSRDHFRAHGVYRCAEIDPREIEPTAGGVRIPPLGVEARAIVSCRGFAPGSDPWFGGIAFNAAKGEILTLRVPGLAEERVVHRGVWLAPAGGEVFHCGATYTWDQLNSLPTAAGRAEIESRLRGFLRLPYEVIDHRAAVRPVIDAGFPVLGRHPEYTRLAYFNGLGSKGSLLSPFFANQLAAHLCDAGEIDAEVDVRKFLAK